MKNTSSSATETSIIPSATPQQSNDAFDLEVYNKTFFSFTKWMLLLLLLIGLLLLLFIFWPQSKAGKANTENPVNIENIEKQYVPVIENVNNDVPKNPEALDKFSIKDINKPITLLPVDDVFIVYKDELIILDVLKNDKGDGLKIIGVTKSQFGERSILTDQ